VKQVALKPQRGLPGHKGQRVREGEQDHVVPAARLLQEGPAVVDVNGDPGTLVGVVGVQVRAQLIQLRIDLHRVDVLGAHVEGVRDVVAGPGPDYEDIIQRVAGGAHVRYRVGLAHLPDWDDVLMRDPVRGDDIPVPRLRVRDAVVGRPDVGGRHRFRPEDPYHGQGRGYLEQAGSPAVEQQQDQRDDHRPDDRLGVKKRQQA